MKLAKTLITYSVCETEYQANGYSEEKGRLEQKILYLEHPDDLILKFEEYKKTLDYGYLIGSIHETKILDFVNKEEIQDLPIKIYKTGVIL